MRIIKIDVENEEVYEMDINNTLESLYSAIGNGCELIETAFVMHSNPNHLHGDVVFVDEECVIRNNVKGWWTTYDSMFFAIIPQKFANNGILVGSVMTENGIDCTDCTWDLETFRKSIFFIGDTFVDPYFLIVKK